MASDHGKAPQIVTNVVDVWSKLGLGSAALLLVAMMIVLQHIRDTRFYTEMESINRSALEYRKVQADAMKKISENETLEGKLLKVLIERQKCGDPE